jgi:hypothetical protein
VAAERSPTRAMEPGTAAAAARAPRLSSAQRCCQGQSQTHEEPRGCSRTVAHDALPLADRAEALLALCTWPG